MKAEEVVAKWEEVCRLEKELRNRYGYVDYMPSIGRAHEYGYTESRRPEVDDAWIRITGKGAPKDWVRLCDLIQEIRREIGGRVVLLPGNKVLRIHHEFGDLVENDLFVGD